MKSTYLQAAGLGMIAGMRSMSAPAIVSDHLARAQSPPLLHSRLAFLASPRTALLLKALALGELVGDKLPFVPARIAPGPLIARAVSGSLSGAAVCVKEEEQVAVGVLIGAAAALASSYGFYYLRRRLGQVSKLPDPVIAVAEDAVMLGIGITLFPRQG